MGISLSHRSTAGAFIDENTSIFIFISVRLMLEKKIQKCLIHHILPIIVFDLFKLRSYWSYLKSYLYFLCYSNNDQNRLTNWGMNKFRCLSLYHLAVSWCHHFWRWRKKPKWEINTRLSLCSKKVHMEIMRWYFLQMSVIEIMGTFFNHEIVWLLLISNHLV